MKVFAIQKNQSNTYSPRFKQNNLSSQSSIMKISQTGDKVVFSGGSGKTIETMEKELAALEKRLETESLSKNAREALEDAIDTLRIKIERWSGGGSGSEPPMGPEPGGLT